MSDIEKDALNILKTGIIKQKLNGPFQLEIIDKNYREFYKKRLNDKLYDNSMVKFKGLKLRAINCFKSFYFYFFKEI
jgi:hypothetical protein